MYNGRVSSFGRPYTKSQTRKAVFNEEEKQDILRKNIPMGCFFSIYLGRMYLEVQKLCHMYEI